MQLQLLIAQISQLDIKIAHLLDKLNSPITTIPGVGTVIGATIISEIGDIKRFATPAKLVAFAGLDSKIEQSGTSHDSTGKMTKRGYLYLRTALFRVALVLSNIDLFSKPFIKRNALKVNITLLVSVPLLVNFVILFMPFSLKVLPTKFILDFL